MQRIIDAQGPSTCRTDLGMLTMEIAADRDGAVESIDCLRLNRLARMAGAPIDKGAGIMVLKKIGDQVEQGEPLYRIYACEHSEFDLVVAAANSHSGYGINGRLPASVAVAR
jgi:thymidine phosphorylase